MRTPIPLACGFMFGLLSGWAYPGLQGRAWVSLAALGLGTVAIATAAREVPRLWLRAAPALLSLAAFGAGASLVPKPPEQLALPPAGVARLTAWVEDVRYAQPRQARARLRVVSGARLQDGAAIAPNTYLLADPFPMPEGARVQLVATLRPAVAFRNPSPHPPLPAAAPIHGRASLASPDAYIVIEQPWHSRLIDNWRRHLRQRLWSTLPPSVAAVTSSLLLGDPDALGDEDAADVRGSGLSHVFAVSGMHVTLLAGLMVWALTRGLLHVTAIAARCDAPRLAAGLGIPLALSIAALTGGAASGWRASITTAISWLVVACGRKPDGGAVTAAACLVFAATCPLEALRPGFLLSIVATVAILSATRQHASSAAGPLKAAAWLALRTTIATAPIAWWTFGSLPVFGVVANLLLVPLGELLLLLAAAHAAVVSCLPAPLVALCAPLTAAPLGIASQAFLRGCGAFHQLEPHFTLPVLSLAQGMVLSTAVAVGLLASHARTRWLAAGCAVLSLLTLEWHLRHTEQPTHQLRATFVDVGQGDATLIDLPDGRCMLIDAGGNPQGGADPGARALVPLLKARRRDRLDVVVLTHPHPDHYGGLRAVLDAVPVGELWDSGQSAAEAESSATSRQALDLLDMARARGSRIVRPEALCGHPRAFGAALVEVLWPCPAFDAGYDPNDNSLVVRIRYGPRSMLFTGDIEAHAEAALLALVKTDALRADLLKVAHHGSRTSSSEAFLAAVTPKLAIISAGAVNPFGHPHEQTVTRLRRYAAQTIDLGQQGGTTLTFDGARTRMERWQD
jgi:competence protein ComEC